jgi:hypothetical protein
MYNHAAGRGVGRPNDGDPVVDLSAHVCSRKKVRVERNRPSAHYLHGYLLSCCYPVVDGSIRVSDALVLMHVFQDFQPDGYTVIRNKDIVGIRCGAHEHLWDTMLRGEGLLGSLEVPEGITLSSSMQELVQSVASRFQYLIIECEPADEPEQDFYLGEIVAVDTEAIHFRCLNSMARWEDEIAVFPVDKVTRIQFETPYIKRFVKYIGA